MYKRNYLLINIGVLLVFGLLILANSTVISSTNIYGSPYKFALLQIAWSLAGIVGFVFFWKRDYTKLGNFSKILFYVSTVFLIVLAVAGLLPCNLNIPFSPCVNGANRWLYLNFPPLPKIPFFGVLGFQPAELAKFALILYLAFRLSSKDTKPEKYFVIYLIITGLTSLLILLQPNMSTALNVFMIGSIIFFSSGATLKEFFILLPTMALISIGTILVSPYRRERLLTLLNGNVETGDTSGYHIKQVLLALGSGGILGVGFGQSKQKYNYLPEVASDSIFAIIGEEFGFIGTTIIIVLFGLLIYQGLKIARDTNDLTGRLLAVGITSWIGFQFLTNVFAMVKIIPLTGVPIPLISYGGSSMLFTLSALGILMNISDHVKKD
jgi:cell division protein FtsW